MKTYLCSRMPAYCFVIALAAVLGAVSLRSAAPAFTYAPTPTAVDDAELPLALEKDCGVYIQGEILGSVKAQEIGYFMAWSFAYGFEMKRWSRGVLTDDYRVLLGVPVGSEVDALQFVKIAPGAKEFSLNGVAWIPESVPEFVQDCQRERGR